MKLKAIALILAVLVAGVAVCYAADLNMGTWKLNEAKSRLNAGAAKNHTVVYAPDGKNIKVTVDGVGSDGKPTHNEWTGKFDGKDYKVTGDPESDTRAYRVINSRTLAMTSKKGTKVTVTGRIHISADGKSRTVDISTTDAKGSPVTSSAVYDKQ